MARRLRIEYPGAFYHLTSRGDRQQPLFRLEADYHSFLETLGQACAKTGWRVHAFCLLPDHFHLVLETPQANLAIGMKWLLGTYTTRLHRRHGSSGHVFRDRYKAQVVDGDDPGCLRAVCDYVHLHPARAGLLEATAPLRAYPWTSLRWFASAAGTRPEWLEVDRLYRACDLPAGEADVGRRFEERLERERRIDHSSAWQTLRRAWAWGGPAFKNRLLARLERHGRARGRGDLPPELIEQQALRIIAQELAARGWSEADLRERPRTDPEKIRIAQRLRRETVVSIRWIAERLHAGSPHTLRNALQYPSLRARSGLRRRRVRPPQLRTPPASEATAEAAAPERPSLFSDTFDVAWD